MPWMRFTGDFPFTPPKRRRVTIAFKEGHCLRVPRECARQALEAGKAELVVPQPRTREERDAIRVGKVY